jgi:hypothetical protein
LGGAGEKRRSERLPGRFAVAVREKLATWTTSTEDVGARGCRIALKRPMTPGALVQLDFDMGEGAEPLVVHGQVAWVRRTPPLSAGIAFLSVPREAQRQFAEPCSWIDRILAARIRRLEDEEPRRVELAEPDGDVALDPVA